MYSDIHTMFKLDITLYINMSGCNIHEKQIYFLIYKMGDHI